MKYKLNQYAKLNKVTYRTVWNWLKDSKLKTITTEKAIKSLVKMIQLAAKYLIKKASNYFKELDKLAFASKNL